MIDESIDPSTGTSYLTEGVEVNVEDHLGRVHRGVITTVNYDEPTTYSILTSASRGSVELTVTEDRILSRASTGGAC